MLRTATHRDKRFQKRLLREERLQTHDAEAIRAEILSGLKAMWTPEDFEKHSHIIKDYWQALDDFELQAKDSTEEIVFDYDKDVERAVEELSRKVGQEWPALGRMLADNAEFGEMFGIIVVAVMVKDFKGLPTRRDLDRGYLTVDCAEALREAIERFEKDNGVEREKAAAWNDLVLACSARMYLDAEEAKNFVSPSPSETTLPASSVTITSEADGKSPASARSSKKTRASA